MQQRSSSSIPSPVAGWSPERKLGAGAFGTVWLARDPSNRVAVLKLLTAPPGDELRLLSRVHHAAVVKTLGGGGLPVPHLVMELAPGQPLSEQALPEAVAVPALATLSEALCACHRAGVAHGDLKPANVVMEPATQRVTLVDFGLAGTAGGTPRWAAPERLAGGASTPEGDVYGLGLMAWVLLTGALPWQDRGPVALLSRRSEEPLPLPVGPDWLKELVGAMLSPDPAARPTAEAVADVFEAHGVGVPAPTVDELRRRALSARVPRSELDRAVDTWINEGGVLVVSGPEQSGRTHALTCAAIELQARGLPYVTLHASGAPWATVEAALQDPTLPGPPAALPVAADVPTRADAAAEVLLTRVEVTSDDSGRAVPCVVLVDDLDQLDAGTRATVTALVDQGAQVLATTTTHPSNGGAPLARATVVAIHGLDEARCGELLGSVLGVVDDEVVEIARRVTGGQPGLLVDFVLQAVEDGALVWRRHAWVADNTRLERLGRQGPGGRSVDGLSSVERRLGAVVALTEPVEAIDALRLAEADAGALRVLVDGGWLRSGRRLATRSPSIAAALAGGADRELYRRLLSRWLEQPEVPWHRLAPILVGTQDPEAARHLGPRCVRALSELDPIAGFEVAERVCALAKSPDMVAAHMVAAVRAGRPGEGREAGLGWLAGRAPTVQDVPVLLQLCRTEEVTSEDAQAMLRWVELARQLLPDGSAGPEVELARARGLWRAGRREEAEQLVDELERRARLSPDASRWLSCLGLLAQIKSELHGPSVGLAALNGLADEVGRGTSERAVLEGIRGRLWWHAGRPRDAARAFETASASRRALPTIERARLDNNSGLAWYSSNDVERAVVAWERALLGFERVGASLEAVRVGVNLCQGYRELGRWKRAEEAGRRALADAGRFGARAMMATALGNLGDVALWQRQFALAEEMFAQARVLAESEGLADELVEGARRRAELAVWRKEVGAPELVEAALQQALARPSPVEHARGLALRAAVRFAAGETDSAEADADQALLRLRELGVAAELAVARLQIAEASAGAGRKALAAEEAEAVRRFADEFARPPLRAWADRLLARLRPTGDGVLGRLERLTELAVRVARHPELGDLLRELVVAAVELVDADRALVVLTEAAHADEPTVAARSGRPGADVSAPPSMSIVRRALSTRREVVVSDLHERRDLRGAESVVAMHLRAVYCLPLLVDDGSPVGVLYLDSREPPTAIGESTTLLRALAAHASIALRNARQNEAARSSAEHLREIAHDLRNPLSGISLLLEQSLEDGAPPDRDDQSLMLQSVRHALDLVDQTLGARTEEAAVVDLSRAVLEWCALLHPQARRARVRVEIDTDRRGRCRVARGDLHRVFANVFTNALKYAKPGGVVVVRTLCDVDRVGFEVLDDGPGFPVDALPRVFERGYQAPGARPGAGLGLAIVRRIVERHHGTVAAQNRPPGGGAVVVWLPRFRGLT